MTALQSLDLTGTQVLDLQPITELSGLFKGQSYRQGLHFRDTPAAKSSLELTHLSEISDNKQRTHKTLAYLKTLSPYPAPTFQKLMQKKMARPLAHPELHSAPPAPSRKDIEALSRQVYALQTKLGAQTNQTTNTESQIASLSGALENARTRLRAFEEDTKGRIEKADNAYKESMEAAKEAFSETLATEAPVKLWLEKQGEHETSRDAAYKGFKNGLYSILFLVLCILIVLAWGPNWLDTLLSPAGCEPAQPDTCKGFGLRGFIATASALTSLTVLLWFTRLQMKFIPC